MQDCEWTPALVTKPSAVTSVIKQELPLSDVTILWQLTSSGILAPGRQNNAL